MRSLYGSNKVVYYSLVSVRNSLGRVKSHMKLFTIQDVDKFMGDVN